MTESMKELKNQIVEMINDNQGLAEKLGNYQGLEFDEDGLLVGISDETCIEFVSTYIYVSGLDEEQFEKAITELVED